MPRRPAPLTRCPGCDQAMIDPERFKLCSACRNPEPESQANRRRVLLEEANRQARRQGR